MTMTSVGSGGGRRDALLRAKCTALVRARWGSETAERATAGGLPGGAGLAVEGTAWVLAEDAPAGSLGAAMIWADRFAGAGSELHVLAAGAAGLLARRAGLFRRPITVHAVDGTELRTVPPAAISPAGRGDAVTEDPAIAPIVDAFGPLFADAGADLVVEGGVVRAEVRGLEVARIEVDGAGAHLAVGVGMHDRDAQREIHGTAQGFDQLFEVVRIVAEHRIEGAEGHAAYHLAGERWLRSVVVRRPDLVGAAELTVVPSPVVREDLRQSAPAPAAGVDADGRAVLVVCSVGLDVDFVPVAADAWLSDGRQPRVVLCIPEADDHRVTRQLAASLAVSAEVVTVAPGWRAL